MPELAESERQVALQRFQLLHPHLEAGVTLTAIAQEHGLPLRTLQRWVQRYRDQGLVGLVRKKRADQGQHHIRPELQQAIEGLVLQKPAPSLASVQRKVTQIALVRGWEIPSYGTIRNIVLQLDAGMRVLAQQGSKAYREAFDLLHQRDATAPNEIWQADHTLLKICLMNPHGEPARPWLTVIMDDYSRAIAGYYLGFEIPTSLATALTLHQAIWHKPDPHWSVCGIPQSFYTDHGGDFTSRHMEQVSADLKMRLIFSTPGMPRGRGRVERFFGTVKQMLLAELPGYTPDDHLVDEPELTLDAFDIAFRHFLLHTYHERVHSVTGQPPQAMWRNSGFLPQLPENLEQLDLLLATIPHTRRVRQEGIRLHNLWYFDLNLSAYIGEEVVIRYDPRDMAEIRVYHDHRFVCRAICHELAGTTTSLKEIQRQRNARRRQLQREIKTRQTLADAYLKPRHDSPEAKPELDDSHQPATPLKRYRHD
jgi:putative transposase